MPYNTAVGDRKEKLEENEDKVFIKDLDMKYEDAIKNEGISSELLYNLGNAYYRTGNNGKAMLNYERALLMSPNDSDILANIEFVRSNLIDKIHDNRHFISRIWDDIISLMSANSWAWASFTIFIIKFPIVNIFIFDKLNLFKSFW